MSRRKTGSTKSRKMLGLELLEPRCMMAGDAGSTRATAADLGLLRSSQSVSGSLSFSDTADVFRFEVDRPMKFIATLDSLRYDADLLLLDSSGRAIARSQRGGSATDQVQSSLVAGVYFVGVTAQTWRSNNYRLRLSGTSTTPPLPTPALIDTPLIGTPPITTPVSNTPVTTIVSPLADVPYFGTSQDWNLNSINAPESWAAGFLGQGVTVAVIDTGVDLDHPELVSQLFVNPGEISGNGIDDDGNGFVDDVSGWDFASGDNKPDDVNGHGTHVAGTIAARNDGVGVTGVAPQARILPVRVLGNNGSGSSDNVAAGIRYAADMGAKIINLSLGGGYSQVIDSAIRYAGAVGSLIVAAAGNESASLPGYPARFSVTYDNVISVGAFDSSSRLGSFSNHVGPSRAIQVDAPGVGIRSTYVGGRLATFSGTSMATPHLAGVAALVWSANPRLTAAQVRNLIVGGTIGSATGSDAIGKLSASTSVAYAAAGWTSLARGSSSAAATTVSTANANVFRSRSIDDAMTAAPPTMALISRNAAWDDALATWSSPEQAETMSSDSSEQSCAWQTMPETLVEPSNENSQSPDTFTQAVDAFVRSLV